MGPTSDREAKTAFSQVQDLFNVLIMNQAMPMPMPMLTPGA